MGDCYDLNDVYGEDRCCPQCGKPMTSDSDGDGVMTMSYDYCEDCGEKDYGEPVRITESLIAAARESGQLPN